MNQSPAIKDIASAVDRLAADTVYPPDAPPQPVTGPGRPRKLGLVLSGGGASGAFEAGVIEELAKAIESHNTAHPANRLEIDVVIGTSTGALNTWGLLLHHLGKKGLWKEPAWLTGETGSTVNFRLWSRIASYASPSKFVLDKTWLLHLLQGATSRWLTFVMLGLLLPLGLILLSLLPELTGLARIMPGWPAWALWLSAAGALAIPLLLFFLLSSHKGILQNSGRPLAGCLLILATATAAGGIARASLVHAIAADPWGIIVGYGIPLICGACVLGACLISACGAALFGNSRLARLLAALGGADCRFGSLRRAVSRSTAQRLCAETAPRIAQAWSDSGDHPPVYVSTATNISAERQGLFVLGRPADAALLDNGAWLPIRIDTGDGSGGNIGGEGLLTGVMASTAIPATYPPEIITYDYRGQHRHVFVDGGVLDFAAYHAAIDLGCTHLVSIETDCMDHDLFSRREQRSWIDLLSNVAATTYTGSDEKARLDAARVAKTNASVVHDPQEPKKKQLVLFVRIAPAPNERMITAEEFDGRYKDGHRVNTLADWIAYGQRVNPAAGRLPKQIWYRDPNGDWRANTSVQGPLIWDASFIPSPGSAAAGPAPD